MQSEYTQATMPAHQCFSPAWRAGRSGRRWAVPLLCGILVGCAAPPAVDTAQIPPDRYADAFQAAKDALRAHHFDLARVDAARGVITTRPRSSSGLATPWINHADSFGESVEGLLHRDRRRAIVRFDPIDEPDAGPLVDRRRLGQPLRFEVRVEVERTYVLGRRADATSIRLTSRALDPDLVAQGLHPIARDQVGTDPDLAGRIARSIERSVSRTDSE